MDLVTLQSKLKKGGVNQANIGIYSPILFKYFTQENFTDEDIYRFLANALNETGCFTVMRENLFYTTPERLVAVFPSIFKNTKYNPNDYVKNAQKLANFVYDSRVFPQKASLGNNQDGDGFKYRGGGFFQTTGRSGFTTLSKVSGIDFISNSDLIIQPEYAVRSAVEFWKFFKLGTKPNLTEVRRVIGGSLFGLQEVTNYYNKIRG